MRILYSEINMHRVKVEYFPNCCKARILCGFAHDDAKDYSSYPYKFLSGKEIYTRIKISLLSALDLHPEDRYEQIAFIAAVNKEQSIAEKVLKEFGFVKFNTTINPGSDGEEVYYYSKVEEFDMAEEEEYEEEYWGDEDD